jgi:hypothetical protein
VTYHYNGHHKPSSFPNIQTQYTGSEKGVDYKGSNLEAHNGLESKVPIYGRSEGRTGCRHFLFVLLLLCCLYRGVLEFDVNTKVIKVIEMIRSDLNNHQQSKKEDDGGVIKKGEELPLAVG